MLLVCHLVLEQIGCFAQTAPDVRGNAYEVVARQTFET